MEICNYQYIKEEWKENIRNYKFKGKDSSLVYNYIASPICNYLVKYVPKWMA
jgi:hypothetical protein